MPHFYWRLVERTPSLLWRSLTGLDKAIGALALIFGAVGVSAWQQLLPWWSPFAAFGVILFYGFLRENYEEFREIEAEKQALVDRTPTDEKRRAYKDLLGAMYREGVRLDDEVWIDDADQRYRRPDDVRTDLIAWRDDVCALLRDALGGHEAELFQGEFGEHKLERAARGTLSMREWLDDRLRKLGRLIERADAAELRPDFDPEKWGDR